jgi:hypothetical protein
MDLCCFEWWIAYLSLMICHGKTTMTATVTTQVDRLKAEDDLGRTGILLILKPCLVEDLLFLHQNPEIALFSPFSLQSKQLQPDDVSPYQQRSYIGAADTLRRLLTICSRCLIVLHSLTTLQ